VEWEEGKKKPKTRQLNNLAGAGALGGAFWGLLFGLIFLVPLLGAAVGAATGALSASLADVGIDDTFIDGVRDQVTPGTSALFVIANGRGVDQIAAALEGHEFALLRTNLTYEQARRLYAALGEESASRVGG